MKVGLRVYKPKLQEQTRATMKGCWWAFIASGRQLKRILPFQAPWEQVQHWAAQGLLKCL